MTCRRDIAVLLTILLAACSPQPSAPNSAPTSAATTLPLATPIATSAEASFPTAVPTPTYQPVTVDGFTTPSAGDATTWTSIRWTKLAAGDPRALVRSVTHWSRGWIALGDRDGSSLGARTPVWTSTDGTSWQPLPASAFGPSSFVLNIEATSSGLAAVTVQAGDTTCKPPEPVLHDCWRLARPIQAWTSIDAMTWTEHPFPDLSTLGSGVAPWFVSSTAGLLVSIPADADHLAEARSTDGTDWQTVEAGLTLGAGQLDDLRSTPFGLVGVGPVDSSTGRAVVLSTVDGATWTSSTLPVAPAGGDRGIELVSTTQSEAGRTIVAGREGVVVIGGVEATPGQELWWQTSGGSQWRSLTGYPPLGPTTGQGEGVGNYADGTLSSDGDRIVAFKSGRTPASWDSFDGLAWRRLPISGAAPGSSVSISVLPWGLLAIDGSGAWWGDANAP
ncbi:MAG: hypothetical protein ACHQ3P_04570 [Candidatus Limnocylindrales bacterium]